MSTCPGKPSAGAAEHVIAGQEGVRHVLGSARQFLARGGQEPGAADGGEQGWTGAARA